MPFKCFNNSFYYSSKRYHTAAKHNATAFFDSSFNYIRQNSHLLSLETISKGARNHPNPHPANSTTTNYLQFDYNGNNNILVNDDENNNNNNNNNTRASSTTLQEPHPQYQNPITFILPYQLDQVAHALNKSSQQNAVQKVASVNISDAFRSSQKFTHIQEHRPLEQRHHLHTSALQRQVRISYEDQGIAQRESSVSPTTTSQTLVDFSALENKEPEEPAPKYFQGSTAEDLALEQNESTFLHQQTNEIFIANDSQQFEKIHSLYMAIKRNNIIPSRDVYAIVLASIVKRTIDDSLDEKLSVLLNVYQDLVQNRIKPDAQIYTNVISALLSSSINSYADPKLSSNGADFFKIAIDIFNASNCSQVQQFDCQIIDSVLIGMNLYPGIVNPAALINFLTEQDFFSKTHIYYIALINHCKFTKNSEDALALYEEFKVESINSSILADKQFSVYSALISTLVETNEVTLATKFLDKLLQSIKNYSEYDDKLNMLLTSYILSLSKQNSKKALEIWGQFNKISWIPEFSYEFYSHLLNDAQTYSDGLKIYNYMVALSKSNKVNTDLETILFKPRFVDSISRFIVSAVQENDKTNVLKAIKESFIRKTNFDYVVYPVIFQFLQNGELCTKIINAHGSTMNDGFEFISYLTSVPNLDLNYEAIMETQFFQKLIQQYKLYDQKNYLGFYQILQSVFQSQPPKDQYLNLLAPLIIEFHDLDNYYTEVPNQETLDFKTNLTKYFKNLMTSAKVNELSDADLSKKLSPMSADAVLLMKQL